MWSEHGKSCGLRNHKIQTVTNEVILLRRSILHSLTVNSCRIKAQHLVVDMWIKTEDRFCNLKECNLKEQ